MISVSLFVEFCSGSVQCGEFRVIFSAVAENLLVSNHVLYCLCSDIGYIYPGSWHQQHHRNVSGIITCTSIISTEFSQHSIFSSCRISIFHFLKSAAAAAASPKEPHSNGRCWLFCPLLFFPQYGSLAESFRIPTATPCHSEFGDISIRRDF